MTEWILAASFTVAAVLSFVRLPPCHPAQLWLVPWAAVLVLYAMKLIPYRDLSGLTVLLIAAGSAAFVAGTLPAARLVGRRRLARRGDWNTEVLQLAAALAALATATLLVAFIGQVAMTHGLRAALISDQFVRVDIAAGATAITIKYIYFAFTTAVLAALAAARTSGRARLIWVAVAATAVATQYFSTGRANVLLAAIMALVAYALGRDRFPARRTVLLAALATVVATIPLFLALGALLGKSFDQSDLRTYDNAFVNHEWAQPLALPYQYATAPIPSLNEVVAVTGPFGRADGCSTLRLACSLLRRVSPEVQPDPQLTAFTGKPMPWNTFTALYAPLVDVGPYLSPLILLGLGLLCGAFWGAAMSRTAAGVALFAGMSPAIAYSTVENNMLAPHLLGAGVLAVLALMVAARLEPLLPRWATRPAERRVRSARW